MSASAHLPWPMLPAVHVMYAFLLQCSAILLSIQIPCHDLLLLLRTMLLASPALDSHSPDGYILFFQLRQEVARMTAAKRERAGTGHAPRAVTAVATTCAAASAYLACAGSHPHRSGTPIDSYEACFWLMKVSKASTKSMCWWKVGAQNSLAGKPGSARQSLRLFKLRCHDAAAAGPNAGPRSVCMLRAGSGQAGGQLDQSAAWVRHSLLWAGSML